MIKDICICNYKYINFTRKNNIELEEEQKRRRNKIVWSLNNNNKYIIRWLC
jgi:hypothetical protein